MFSLSASRSGADPPNPAATRPDPTATAPAPGGGGEGNSDDSSSSSLSTLPSLPSTSTLCQQAPVTIKDEDLGYDSGSGNDDGLPRPNESEVYYFAYGVDFDPVRMKEEILPDAVHLGLARLDGFRWLLCGPPRRECSLPPTGKLGPEGRATITKADPGPASSGSGSAGSVVYGRLYIISAADLRAYAAGGCAHDYELVTLPPVTLMAHDSSCDDGEGGWAKDPVYASLPHPLREARVIPAFHAMALVASARRYAMPRRLPGTWHAEGLSEGVLLDPVFSSVGYNNDEDGEVKKEEDEDEVGKKTKAKGEMGIYYTEEIALENAFAQALARTPSLRDVERAVARPFVVAALRARNCLLYGDCTAAAAEEKKQGLLQYDPRDNVGMTAMRSPFPAIEEARRARGDWPRLPPGKASSAAELKAIIDADIQPRIKAQITSPNTSTSTSIGQQGGDSIFGKKEAQLQAQAERDSGGGGGGGLDPSYLHALHTGLARALRHEGLLPRWYVDEAIRPWVPWGHELELQIETQKKLAGQSSTKGEKKKRTLDPLTGRRLNNESALIGRQQGGGAVVPWPDREMEALVFGTAAGNSGGGYGGAGGRGRW